MSTKQDEYHQVRFKYDKVWKEWEKTRDKQKWQEVEKLQKRKNQLRDEIAAEIVLDTEK